MHFYVSLALSLIFLGAAAYCIFDTRKWNRLEKENLQSLKTATDALEERILKGDEVLTKLRAQLNEQETEE